VVAASGRNPQGGCGLGGVTTALAAVAPPHYRVPSSVVHTRREVGDLHMCGHFNAAPFD
jgi:hypothetical protein